MSEMWPVYPPRWNTMRQMREALGMPLGHDGIEEFLWYWDSISQDDRVALRHMDLSDLKSSGIQMPEVSNAQE